MIAPIKWFVALLIKDPELAERIAAAADPAQDVVVGGQPWIAVKLDEEEVENGG